MGRSSTWGGGCSILIKSSYISPPAYTSSRPYTSEYSSSSSWRQFSLSYTHTYTQRNKHITGQYVDDLSLWVKAKINSGAFTITVYLSLSLHDFQLTSKFEIQNKVWLHLCFLTLPFLSLSFIQNVSGSWLGTWCRWRTLLNAKHAELLICSIWQQQRNRAKSKQTHVGVWTPEEQWGWVVLFCFYLYFCFWFCRCLIVNERNVFYKQQKKNT